jgi:hypothetical protein
MKEFKFLVGHINPRWSNTRHGERRVFNIDVGNLSVEDIEYYIRQLTTSMAVPVQYIDHVSLISSRGLRNE